MWSKFPSSSPRPTCSPRGELTSFNSYGSICAINYQYVYIERSKLERDVGVELIVEVTLLFVMQMIVIAFGLFQALGVGLAKYVVGEDSLAETGVSGQRLTYFHILLAVLVFHVGLRPLGVFAFDCLVEVLGAALGELVNFFAG